jgi:hypothetical protein
MSLKYQGDARLTQSLNKLLDEMPLIEPPSTFTDRVMCSVLNPEHRLRLAPLKSRRKTELINSLVAAAATILLIQSGIVNRVLTIDKEITQLTAYIQQISHLLQS